MPDPLDSYRPGQLMRLLQGRYEFLGLLGRGGCGLVFEVENRSLGRREAIKFFSQSFARDGSQRFAQEARIMAALDHPQIVPIYSFGEEGGCLWYAMKLVEGPPLSSFLKPRGQSPMADALRVGIPLLEALAFTHARGIIHRDIKPGNILLDPQAGPILTDFGIAKAENNLQHTETGAFLGTPAYISPEQGLGQPVDGRTDLYALGVVLYQMVAGRLPFGEGNSLAVMLQRLQTEAESPRAHRPDLPEELARVIEKALARDPDRRFATALEMSQALIRVAETQGLDWQGPLAIPPGLGPPREPIPLEWSSAIDAADPTAWMASVSGTAGQMLGTEKAQPRKSRSAWAVGVVVLGGLAAAGWGTWHRRTQPIPEVIAPRPHPQAPRPDPPPPQGFTTATALPVKRPGPEPQLIRRAVTPAQLLEPPLVDKFIDPGCSGKTATVEVHVDETGSVSAARVLSPLVPACQGAVLKAARACRFRPALAADGQPVPSTLAIAIDL